MTDEELRADVLDELRSEPAPHRSRIYVYAREGTVTLAGQVATFAEKQKLDAAALRVAGVKALDTQISIRRFAAISEPIAEPVQVRE